MTEFPDWPVATMKLNLAKVREAYLIFGPLAARQLSEHLGFPKPPLDLTSPVEDLPDDDPDNDDYE